MCIATLSIYETFMHTLWFDFVEIMPSTNFIFVAKCNDSECPILKWIFIIYFPLFLIRNVLLFSSL